MLTYRHGRLSDSGGPFMRWLLRSLAMAMCVGGSRASVFQPDAHPLGESPTLEFGPNFDRHLRAGLRRRSTLGIELNEIDLEVKSRGCKLLIWCALHDSNVRPPGS
jgi:hypothetical protein